MFLQLNHQKLEVYVASREFVLSIYRATKLFPAEEKFSMVSQVRRAALSVHLNIAEGSSRRSETDRKRFYEIARGSLIEIDAALDISHDLEYLRNINLDIVGEKMIQCFKLLSGMIR